ncbi:MAG: site-specific integrase [Thermoplasmatales archaeon]
MPGNIKMIRKGYYRVTVEAGKDPATGNRKRVVRYVHGREAEAKDLLAALISALDHGTYIQPSKMTVGEWLYVWLDDFKQMSVTETTWDNYETMVRVHLIPAIGALPIQELRTEHLQALYRRKLYVENKSLRTVHLIHFVIKAALKKAKKHKPPLVKENVAEEAELPPLKTKEAVPLSQAQKDILLPVIRDDKLAAAWILHLGSGMRRGEVLGLDWGHLDLDNALVDVRQQYVQTRRGPTLKSPKTEKSIRIVPLSPPVVAALRCHQLTMQAKGWYGPDQPVFVTRVGTRMQPRNFLRRFKALLRQAGIDPTVAHIHTLRHTFVSMLLEQGEELVTVKELVGHARLAHTSDLYAHLSDRFKRRAVDKLGSLLESDKSPGEPPIQGGHQMGTKAQKVKAPDPRKP